MKSIRDGFKKTGTLHHAYCIEGGGEGICSEIADFLENDLGFPTRGNPDYYFRTFDAFTIDDAREIRELHSGKAFGPSGRKAYLIRANTILREAQNALLKVFEEPSAGHHFFIVLPNAEDLLPTLRSRLWIVKGEGDATAVHADPAAFMRASKPKRLEMVKDMLAAIEGETMRKSDVTAFLRSLEKALAEDGVVKHARELRDIAAAASYMADRSASAKLILESVALSF